MLGAMGRLAPLAALALVLATVLQLTATPARDPVRRPNVVVILTDDQTVGDMSVMPRTRRLLGTRGVTFTNSFVSYPLCCPSRATYLTGQYAHNHRVWGNRPPLGGYGRLREAHTLPVWLQRAGYNTLFLGKYLNGYGSMPLRDGTSSVRYVPPGWMRRKSRSPMTPITTPINGTSRAPSLGTSCCANPAPIMIPTVNGREASPASSGE
jgi:hypothetical protein